MVPPSARRSRKRPDPGTTPLTSSEVAEPGQQNRSIEPDGGGWGVLAPSVPAVLVRAEGEFLFPDQWARVMGESPEGIWVDNREGSTGIIRPSK